MKNQIVMMVGVLLASASFTAKAAREIRPEGYVGSVHGTAAACKEVMPDAVKLGLAKMNAEFEGYGINLSQVVEMPDYKKSFAEETYRIRSLTVEERIKACEWVFGKAQTPASQHDANGAAQPPSAERR